MITIRDLFLLILSSTLSKQVFSLNGNFFLTYHDGNKKNTNSDEDGERFYAYSYTPYTGTSCSSEYPCVDRYFCNFDKGAVCERCPSIDRSCTALGVPQQGVTDCQNRCKSDNHDIITINVMLPPGDRELCNFPTSLIENTTHGVMKYDNEPPIALLVSRGACSFMNKTNVILEMRQKFSVQLDYIIFHNREDADFGNKSFWEEERDFYLDQDNSQLRNEIKSPTFLFSNNDLHAILFDKIIDVANDTMSNPYFLEYSNRSWMFPLKLERIPDSYYDSYYDDDDDDEVFPYFKEISLVPKFVAALSILGSSYIIYSLAGSSRSRRKNLRVGKTFNRLLLALAVSDIISSAALFFASWAIPRGYHPYGYEELSVYKTGNLTTCKIQAFIFHFGMTACVLITGFIALQSLLTVRFRWTGSRMNKAERFFLAFSFLFSLVMAVVLLLLESYGACDTGFCWISPDKELHMILFGSIWIFLVFVIVLIVMVILFLEVRLTENRSARWSESAQEARKQKQFLIKAILFIGAYLTVWTPAIIGTLFPHEFPSKSLIIAIFLPMQGFLNAIVHSNILNRCCFLKIFGKKKSRTIVSRTTENETGISSGIASNDIQEDPPNNRNATNIEKTAEKLKKCQDSLETIEIMENHDNNETSVSRDVEINETQEKPLNSSKVINIEKSFEKLRGSKVSLEEKENNKDNNNDDLHTQAYNTSMDRKKDIKEAKKAEENF